MTANRGNQVTNHAERLKALNEAGAKATDDLVLEVCGKGNEILGFPPHAEGDEICPIVIDGDPQFLPLFVEAANSRATLALAVRIVEAVQTLRDQPGCAWCGSPSVAYINRFDGQQTGDCCSSCMRTMDGTFKVLESRITDTDALDALLRQWASDTGTGEDV